MIEEGCKAIVVDSAVPENIGKIVTVGKFIGSFSGYINGDKVISSYIDTWEVNKPMKFIRSDNRDCVGEAFYQSEKNLKRIYPDNTPADDSFEGMMSKLKEKEKA